MSRGSLKVVVIIVINGEIAALALGFILNFGDSGDFGSSGSPAELTPRTFSL